MLRLQLIGLSRFVFTSLLITSCSVVNTDPSGGRSLNLVDETIATAVAGEAGWNYQRSGRADLDTDGTVERVVLASEVVLARGRPAWDDGHHWQVYVESADGERTQLYAQRLQLGMLTLRLTGEVGGPKILLIEHLPDSIKVYEIVYNGPGDTSQRVLLHRQLDPRGDLASPQYP